MKKEMNEDKTDVHPCKPDNTFFFNTRKTIYFSGLSFWPINAAN